MSDGSESPGCRSEASDQSMTRFIDFKRRKQNDGSSSPASTDFFSVESDPPGDASLCSTSQGGNRAPERRKRKVSLREQNLALREQHLTLREQNLTLREQNLALKEENRTQYEQNLKEKQALREHNRALNEQNRTLNEQILVLKKENWTLKKEDPWEDPSLFISEGHRVVKDPHEKNLSREFPGLQSDLSSLYDIPYMSVILDDIFNNVMMSPP